MLLLYLGKSCSILLLLLKLFNFAAPLMDPNVTSVSGQKLFNFAAPHWLPVKQRVFYKILLFGHRLVHHQWKIPVYLGALVFRNDKVTR